MPSASCSTTPPPPRPPTRVLSSSYRLPIGIALLALLLAVFFAPPFTRPSTPAPPFPKQQQTSHNMAIPPIVIGPIGKHTATLIFSHGLGDSGAGWRSFAQSMSPRFPGFKFVLPTAPERVVTAAGRKMNAWFDVFAFGGSTAAGEDAEGMLQAVADVDALIQVEVDSGIPEERIVVGGFSQGAIISFLVGLTTKRKLAGILGLSGRLGLPDQIGSLQTDLSKGLPIFWGHGTFDEMIAYQKAEYGVGILKGLGLRKLSFKTYPGMGHSTCPAEVDDIKAFLLEILP